MLTCGQLTVQPGDFPTLAKSAWYKIRPDTKLLLKQWETGSNGKLHSKVFNAVEMFVSYESKLVQSRNLLVGGLSPGVYIITFTKCDRLCVCSLKKMLIVGALWNGKYSQSETKSIIQILIVALQLVSKFGLFTITRIVVTNVRS